MKKITLIVILILSFLLTACFERENLDNVATDYIPTVISDTYSPITQSFSIDESIERADENANHQSVTVTTTASRWVGCEDWEPPAPIVRTQEILQGDTIAIIHSVYMTAVDIREDSIVVQLEGYGVAPLIEGRVSRVPSEWIVEIAYGELYFISTTDPGEGEFWSFAFEKN